MNEDTKHTISQKAEETMKDRYRFYWKFIDLFYNTLGYLRYCFRCCVNKKNPMNIQKRLEIYNIGEDKYIKEFDAIEFAKNMRNLNTLLKAMLNKEERYLVQHQKSHVLILDDDEPKPPEPQKVPKLFTQKEAREVYNSKIEKFMVLVRIYGLEEFCH